MSLLSSKQKNVWQMFEGFIWSLLHHSISGVVALATPQVVRRTCLVFLLCDLIYRTPFPEKLYTSLFCVLFLRPLSRLMTKRSLTQLSSAHLNMVPLSNRGACLVWMLFSPLSHSPSESFHIHYVSGWSPSSDIWLFKAHLGQRWNRLPRVW